MDDTIKASNHRLPPAGRRVPRFHLSVKKNRSRHIISSL